MTDWKHNGNMRPMQKTLTAVAGQRKWKYMRCPFCATNLSGLEVDWYKHIEFSHKAVRLCSQLVWLDTNHVFYKGREYRPGMKRRAT